MSDPTQDPDAAPTALRDIPRGLALVVSAFAVLVSLTHIVLAFQPLISELERNAFHFGVTGDLDAHLEVVALADGIAAAAEALR